MSGTSQLQKIARLTDRIILPVNYALAVLLVLSYLSPIINPQSFWPLAILGLVYPLLLILNVVFVIYWLLRRKRYAFISLVCILMGIKVLVNTYGFHPSGAGGPKQQPGYIRVMNYNVHDFNISYPNEAATKPLMLKLIGDEQPDVICFEEYYSWRRQNPYQVCDTLQQILKTTNYYFEPFAGTTTYDIGLAIYTKYPIINRGVIQVCKVKEYNPGIFCDVKYHDKIVRIYCLHLQSMQFEPKDYSYIDTGSIRAKVSLHSSWHVVQKLKAAFIQRSKQVAIVKAHAKLCPYPYIFSGDFNDTPASYTVHQMEIGLNNSFADKGHGFGATFNGNIPNYQIDYIMSAPQFEVMSYKVIRQKLSDHYPICSDLQLK